MPDLQRSIIVYSGPQQTTAIDYSDPSETDFTRSEFAAMANMGESATSTWVVRDEQGRIPDYRANLNKFLSSHNYTVLTVGSNTLWRGRIDAQDVQRGAQRGTRPHEYTSTMSDPNSHLRGIVVHNWERPSETDAARVQALVAAYLSGNPRVTTNLNGSNFVITGSNTTTLKPRTYTAQTPAEILAHMAEVFDKEMFVDTDNNLHYHGHDYSGFDSTLRISDDIADLNANTCLTIEPKASEESGNQLTSVRLYWGSDEVQRSVVVNDTPSRTTDYWQEAIFDSEAETATEAEEAAQGILDARRLDQISYQVRIGKPGVIQDGNGTPMTGDDLPRIKAGMRIQFKSRAARSGINAAGTFTGDSFLLCRIREVRWTMPTPDAYWCDVTLERPLVPVKRNGRTAPRSSTPKPAPEFVPDPSDTLTKFYNANDPGGDALNWDNALENQGGSGDGANGTDFYIYRSALPDVYQDTWAFSAGDSLRVSGYIGCDSDGILRLAFLSEAPGLDGGSVDPLNVLATYNLSPAQPGHEHAPEWTLFTAGPFEAPVGTTSVALTRTAAVSFDELSIFTIDGGTVENDPHAIDYGDCPHDSPHYWPSDYAECVRQDLEDQIAALSSSGGSELDWFVVTDLTYGAIGDGTTDDTAAIQAAIDAAVAVNGLVYFPAGTYKITSVLSVTESIRLLGASTAGSVIQQATSNTGAIAATTDAYRLYMSDLTIDGPATHASGIGISTVRQLVAENVSVLDFDVGIEIGTSSFYSKLERVGVFGCGSSGIYLTDGSNNTDITDVNIDGLGATDLGIYVEGSEKIGITGGSVENCTVHGIRVDSGTNNTGGVAIQGVYFENNSGCTDIGIGTINDTVRGGVIFGCKFTNGVTRHIDIQYAEAFTIGGNDFRDTGSTVRIQDPATGIVILPNRNDGTYTTNSGTTVLPDAIGDPIQETLIDAKGDLIAGSAADTAVRVAVGTNGDVLTADSTATGGVSWQTPSAGGSAQILLESGHAVPFTFDEILQESDGSGFLYASE